MKQDELPDGWIKHDGGPCPVDQGSRPSIMFPDGLTLDTAAYNSFAGDLRWSRRGMPTDIIAYKPEPKP